ncbi:TetR/AcrR family transcriptional regulator [Saxibacter everestensis]|uniref:TetR/AcrR family transcriptional regulator n=1 Tax=Saxibacter everestensis TaxID=2909229 RepID=A0ABY8QSA4_9MICO|nr:TetR/AcrR family transcriptional regulator [Brevibacteriaceae bacterium ZFBP1038]
MVPASSSSPITARRAQTRERLMSAAMSVFAERGILGASVEEICDQAGFTRGAFYSNFSSKDELFFELVEHQQSRHVEALRHIVDTVLKPAGPQTEEAQNQVLTRAIDAFLAVQRSDREWVLAQSELKLYAIRNPQVAARYSALESEVRKAFGDILKEGLELTRREFTVSFSEAITILGATHEQQLFDALIDPDGTMRSAGSTSSLYDILVAITRPVS